MGLAAAVAMSVAMAAAPSRAAPAAPAALPPAAAAIVSHSGLPLQSFALAVRPVENGEAPPLLWHNAEQPFLLASTTKLVTSLAALDLLGAQHRWRTSAYATGPVSGGRLDGDLVIVGGPVGLTGNELRRWFAQMRGEGLHSIAGQIVLDDVALLHERDPKQVRVTEAERSADAPADARAYNKGKLLVSIAPGPGGRAVVTLTPRPANVLVVNDVLAGGGCSAWARWKSADEIEAGPPLQLWVRGRWSADCGADDIAYVAPPAAVRLEPELGAAPALPVALPRMVAGLWAEGGGVLRGGVVERAQGAARPRTGRWSSELETPVSEVLREMNKTSNNEAARSVLLSLGLGGAVPAALRPAGQAQTDPSASPAPSAQPARPAQSAQSAQPAQPARPAQPDQPAQRAGQERMRAWLRSQGLRDGDITVVLGSGESRAERGRPRALVELLRTAWRSPHAQVLVDSLPIAGVDGTLVRRLRNGPATGQAFLKTGTLSDTRALAGYVRARSGRVYAVVLIVTDPEARLAVPALDALVEWVARAG